jgi:hypothetical protein
MVPGDRQAALDVAVGALGAQDPQETQVLTNAGKCSLGVRVTSDGDCYVDAVGNGAEALSGDGEGHRVIASDLKSIVPPSDVGVGPSPDEPAVVLGPIETRIERVGEDLHRRAPVEDADESGEVIDYEVIDRPAGARLPDDDAGETPSTDRALAVRSGPEAGEHLVDRGTVPKRRDPELLPYALGHSGIGGHQSHGRRGSPGCTTGREEPAQQELSCQENSDAAGGCGVDQVDGLAAAHREVDKGEGSFVDPTEVHPVRSP